MNTDLAQLKKHVASMSGGLNAKVYEGGKTHSHRGFLTQMRNCDANAL